MFAGTSVLFFGNQNMVTLHSKEHYTTWSNLLMKRVWCLLMYSWNMHTTLPIQDKGSFLFMLKGW